MKKIRNLVPMALVGLLLSTATVVAQEADDGDAEVRKTVRVLVKQSGETACEGEDCEQAHRFVWIGDGDGAEAASEIVVERLENAEGKVLVAGPGRRMAFRAHQGGPSWLEETGGYLGVQLTELTDALRDHFGVRRGTGVMVGEVVAGSPAERAGFRAGDIVIAVDGSEIGGGSELTRSVRALEPGETAAFEVVRDGAQQTIQATVEEREPRLRVMRLHTLGDDAEWKGGDGHAFVYRGCDDDAECAETIHSLSAHGGVERILEMGGIDLESLGCGAGQVCSLECESDRNCSIEVTCEDGKCACEVDGETVDCGD